jgi:hypothetical protein
MNVEIGAEAALFPEKEYISEIFVAVQTDLNDWLAIWPEHLLLIRRTRVQIFCVVAK